MDENTLLDVMTDLDLTNINKSGKWLNCSCPFAPFVPEHRTSIDNSPSFGTCINNDGLSSFHCFTCGNHGTINALVTRLSDHRGEDYDALKGLVSKAEAGVTVVDWDAKRNRRLTNTTKAPTALDIRHYENTYPTVMSNNDAVLYLKSRGVNDVGIKKAGIRYSHREKRVLFPVKDIKKVLFGFTGRTILSPENYPVYERGKFPKIRDFLGLKKEYCILGSDRWVRGKPVLIQEGLMGYAYLLSIGADEIFNIGTTMGAILTPHQASMLISFGEPVYLMYDNDRAGDKALFGQTENGVHTGGGAIDKLVHHIPVLVPAWMDGKIDPDQLTIEDIKYVRKNTALYNDKQLN